MSVWDTPPVGAAATLAACLSARVPELDTPRLRLRAPRIEDFADYAGIVMSDRAVHVGGPMSRRDAWLDFTQMVAGWLLRGHGLWSIERRSDRALVGFLPLDHEVGDAEPAFGWLLSAAAEGHGYAREAAAAARAYADRCLGLAQLVSQVVPETARSIRIAEAIGAVGEDMSPGDDMLVFRHLPVRGQA